MGFIASKLVWLFASPGTLLVFMMLLAGFLCVSHDEARQQFGRKLCFYISLLVFFIGIFPVGQWALLPLENGFPPSKPDHVDGIILVGGDEEPRISEHRNQPTVFDSARRYMTFATLARQYPEAKLIYSGGSGRLVPDSRMKEAEIAKQALAGLGVPVERMTFEDASRNTHENAAMAAAMMHPTPEQNWLLVTSAYHMRRAMGCFRQEGWHVSPATTGYMTDGEFTWKLHFNLAEHLIQMSRAAHEYYGLVAYWLMGYIDSPWPR